ncbi:MAG: hypothetical protein NTW29_20345 [Bacteroidetes bacterium]|nr:hypothetical protein [Bacteroidota bacterium]
MQQKNIAHYFDKLADFNELPPFYKKLEMYSDDKASDFGVPDLNIVPSRFHQTERFTVGFCYKRSGNIPLDPQKLIQKQGR